MVIDTTNTVRSCALNTSDTCPVCESLAHPFHDFNTGILSKLWFFLTCLDLFSKIWKVCGLPYVFSTKIIFSASSRNKDEQRRMSTSRKRNCGTSPGLFTSIQFTLQWLHKAWAVHFLVCSYGDFQSLFHLLLPIMLNSCCVLQSIRLVCLWHWKLRMD